MKRKESEKPEVEYYMKCQLPSSVCYSGGPSGDTEYESDYREAIFKNKPEGFEIAWPTQRLWTTDRDGNTLVKLYLTDRKKAVEDLIDQLDTVKRENERIKKLAKEILGRSQA